MLPEKIATVKIKERLFFFSSYSPLRYKYIIPQRRDKIYIFAYFCLQGMKRISPNTVVSKRKSARGITAASMGRFKTRKITVTAKATREITICIINVANDARLCFIGCASLSKSNLGAKILNISPRKAKETFAKSGVEIRNGQ